MLREVSTNFLLRKLLILRDNVFRIHSKETIEISGIPDTVPDTAVESKVCALLNSIKDENSPAYTSVDIQACHRLKDKGRVICRFVSRKRMRHAVSKRKKLSEVDLKKDHGIDGKIYINESMAFSVKSLDWKCRQLKKAGLLEDCWFFNGNYNVIHKKGDDRQKIIHIDDLCDIVKLNAEEVDKIAEEYKKVKPTPRPRQ